MNSMNTVVTLNLWYRTLHDWLWLWDLEFVKQTRNWQLVRVFVAYGKQNTLMMMIFL